MSQTTILDTLIEIDTAVSTPVIPSGAATSANQTTEIASLATLHSDLGAPLPIRAATATTTNVTQSATSVTLLSANAARKGFVLYNDAGAKVYVKYGTTASATSFTVLVAANAFYVNDPILYTGRIDAIWASGSSGAMRITELT
jgi:hypothetical protein